MLKMLKRLITPIISAILGIMAVNHFNIFDLLPFVPDEYVDKVCITAYFAIANIIVKDLPVAIWGKIQKDFLSKIEVIIFKPGTSLGVDTDAVLEFNGDDLTQAHILIKIIGKKNHFKDVDLIIKKPAFAEIQSTYKRKEVVVDGGNYCIKLEELFGNIDSLSSEQTFKIVMIQDPIDGDTSILISPELSKKKLNLIYKHNNAQLKAVRR